MSATELHQPATDQWIVTPTAHARPQPTATLLPDGRVLVLGGTSLPGEIFDPQTSQIAGREHPKKLRTARLFLTRAGESPTDRHATGDPAALLEQGYEIRTIQELLGHSKIQTTMIQTHLVTQGITGVKSPLDRLRRARGSALLELSGRAGNLILVVAEIGETLEVELDGSSCVPGHGHSSLQFQDLRL